MTAQQTPVSDGTEAIAAALATGSEPHLLSGEQFKRSLRDGRRVVDCTGAVVEDVTTHPHLARTADTLGRVMDLQFGERTRETMTYVDEPTGTRRAIGWQVPTTTEHLYAKRDGIRAVTRETLGVYGRPPDYGPAMALGFLGIIDRVERESEEFAEHIRAFVKKAGELNATQHRPDPRRAVRSERSSQRAPGNPARRR